MRFIERNLKQAKNLLNPVKGVSEKRKDEIKIISILLGQQKL